MFQHHFIDSNRKAIVRDLQTFAAKARAYYARPASAAGGNRSFVGLTIQQLSPRIENENGRYYIESTIADELILVGRNKEIEDGDTIEVRMRYMKRSNLSKCYNNTPIPATFPYRLSHPWVPVS